MCFRHFCFWFYLTCGISGSLGAVHLNASLLIINPIEALGKLLFACYFATMTHPLESAADSVLTPLYAIPHASRCPYPCLAQRRISTNVQTHHTYRVPTTITYAILPLMAKDHQHSVCTTNLRIAFSSRGIIISGDIEPNPGPLQTCHCAICHDILHVTTSHRSNITHAATGYI